MQPWRRKPLSDLARQAEEGQGFRRRLSTFDLCLLGVAVVIGTGVFVLTGKAAAHHAGPAVVASLVLAALAAALGALCYAEMAALIPAAGGVYTYTFAALGEMAAFLVGCDLVAEFTFGAATVAIGWSAYVGDLLQRLLQRPLPERLCQAPWTWHPGEGGWAATGALCNVPAALVVLALTALVARGPESSRWLNRLLVAIKLSAIVAFVVVAAPATEAKNWQPWLPANRGAFGAFGISGVVQGAAMLFFSYCGVEALATATPEAKDPQRGPPVAIAFTLATCLVLYVAVAVVLTGVVPLEALGVADPLALASRSSSSRWLEPAISSAAVAGLTSVMMVQLYCQPRVLQAMAGDGLLPASLAALHPRCRTPTRAGYLGGVACAIIAATLPLELLSEMCSVATLAAFIAVALSVARLRRLAPGAARPFRLPWGPTMVPAATCLVCGGLAAAARGASLGCLAALAAACLAGYWLRGGAGRGHRPLA